MIAGQRAIDSVPAIGVTVEVASDVSRVQRMAASAAARQGFSEEGSRAVERVAVDLATHLVTHQTPGRMLVRFPHWEERRGVELLLSTGSTTPFAAADLREAVLAPDVLEAYSAPESGTVVIAQLWGDPPPTGRADRRFLVGSMSDPIEGETVSGDAWAIEEDGARVVVLVSDGLGHGEQAAAASAAAVSAFRAHHREPVERIAAHLHEALRRTRGAAIALAEVDGDAGELRFCGIGNVVARLLLGGSADELFSQYGIVGYHSPPIRAITRPWPDDAMLVMHSDGLSPTWHADAYPRLGLQHPQLAASTVMRDAVRLHDDALVIALSSSARASCSQHPETVS